MSTTGQRIREIRKNMGLTQKELGRKIGVSAATVTLWEKDKTLPSGDNGSKLVDILNVSWEALRQQDDAFHQMNELLNSHKNKTRANIDGRNPPLFDKNEAKNYLKDINFNPIFREIKTPIPDNLLTTKVFSVIEDSIGLAPEINPGDRISITPELPILIGTYSMFWVNEDILVGKIVMTPRGMYLEFNINKTGWESIPISSDNYIGRVIAIDPLWAIESRKP